MRNNQPATERQKLKLKNLNISFEADITIDDAAMLLKDAILDQMNIRSMRVSPTAMAVGSELDPIGGRQWER